MAKTTKKHRLLLNSLYGHFYDHHVSTKLGCFYCGESATTIDHCPPLTLCDVKTKDWFDERGIKFYKVSSCMDCNQQLGAKPYLKLLDRAMFILDRLEQKTEKIVHWSDDEIEEMSKTFQKMISAKKINERFDFARVRHCQELIANPDDFPVDEYL